MFDFTHPIIYYLLYVKFDLDLAHATLSALFNCPGQLNRWSDRLEWLQWLFMTKETVPIFMIVDLHYRSAHRKWPGILVSLITLTLIWSHAQGRSVGWRRECWKVRLSENDHANSVVQSTKRIVHVFPVPVVRTMRFVATSVCVATATRMERLLKRNGQPISTTTSMSLQTEKRKHFSARH